MTNLAKASVAVIGALAIVAILRDEFVAPPLRRALRGDGIVIDRDVVRRTSLNLGGGKCKWTPPALTVPDAVDFHKTAVVGYPSGDKRITYLQMETLTGWPAKDEWDFAYLGISNHPFIKANYPHHEGIWGWGDIADQIVMVIPHIRRSMVEYHDILWDLGYATTWEEANTFRDNIYSTEPEVQYYYDWRDLRVLDEARWYGWFIDYWMEGGLMRDIFTHRLTTPEHWNDLMLKPFYTREELSIDNYVSNTTVVTPSYDPHCADGEVSDGCEPVAIISADKLLDHADGPNETAAIATALLNDDRMGQYVIEAETWQCIWDELIIQRKGPRIVSDRPSSSQADEYNFSAEMLQEMLDELDRLVGKYGGSDWSGKATADRIVEILTEHRASVRAELDEVNAGTRKLTDKDFLGPAERQRRRELRLGKDFVDSFEKLRERYRRRMDGIEQRRFERKREKVMPW